MSQPESQLDRRTDSFLIEAIYGNYGHASEDRLTQIFAACFNHSPVFRRALMRFVSLRRGVGVSCTTQLHYDVGPKAFQLDAVIAGKTGIPLIVIENKVDAPLLAKQLRAYNTISSIRSSMKCCFVRKVEPKENYPRNWTVFFWQEFHAFLRGLHTNDTIVQDFIRVLEEWNMIIPEKISRTELLCLTSALHSLRYGRYTRVSLEKPVLEAIANYKSMLTEIWNQARKEDLICRRIERNFRCNPWISSWQDERIERGEKRFMLVGWQIRLKKDYRGIRWIGTAICFDDRKDWYSILSYASDPQGSWVQDLKYRKKDLVFADYSKQVLSFWKRVLR